MRSVKSSIEISTPPDRVLRAFVDVDMAKEWWGVDRGLIEPKPGGVWALAWERSDAGYKYSGTGIISSYIPGKELVIEKMVYFNPDRPLLGPMRVRHTVSTMGDVTTLTVIQDGYGEGPDWDWYYEAVVQGWPAALKLLKEYLEKIGREE